MVALDQQYANIMQNHPFGIAVYHPLSWSIFKVGSCGYFDDFGSWHLIADLERPDQLLRKKLNPVDVDELEKAPLDEGIKWGPKVSSNTKAKKIELSGGVDPWPGIPVTASAGYSYSTDSDIGAVLLTSPPITHEQYYHGSPFKNWVKKNAAAIFKLWPEVKKHGLWIVTSTYATKKCAVNMWSSGGRALTVGFSAKALGIGEAGPSGGWYWDRADEGWCEYTAEGDDKLVVFFGGLRFQYKWMLGKELIPRSSSLPTFRGSRGHDDGNQPEYITAIAVPDPEEDAHYVVDCEAHMEEDPEIEEEW